MFEGYSSSELIEMIQRITIELKRRTDGKFEKREIIPKGKEKKILNKSLVMNFEKEMDSPLRIRKVQSEESIEETDEKFREQNPQKKENEMNEDLVEESIQKFITDQKGEETPQIDENEEQKEEETLSIPETSEELKLDQLNDTISSTSHRFTKSRSLKKENEEQCSPIQFKIYHFRRKSQIFTVNNESDLLDLLKNYQKEYNNYNFSFQGQNISLENGKLENGNDFFKEGITIDAF